MAGHSDLHGFADLVPLGSEAAVREHLHLARPDNALTPNFDYSRRR